MEDLFNPHTTEKDIVNDNNGRMSIRRASFARKVTQNKRNIGFQEIIKENGGLPKKGECLLIKSNGTSDTGSLFIVWHKPAPSKKCTCQHGSFPEVILITSVNR